MIGCLFWLFAASNRREELAQAKKHPFPNGHRPLPSMLV
jgi:hypothetical protein